MNPADILTLITQPIPIFAMICITLLLLFYFNRFVRKRNNAENAFSTLDVYLQKRSDLIPDLARVARAYAEHEAQVLTRLTEKRADPSQTADRSAKLKLESDISERLYSLFATAESYPELKSSSHYLELQKGLREIEENIAAARRTYNFAATDLNTSIQSFPGLIFAALFRFKDRPLFEISHGERGKPDIQSILK